MLNYKFILIIIASTFLIGCGDIYEDSSYTACFDGREKTFVDTENDADKKFVDLTNLKVVVGSDCVGASIAVSELPPQLIFNHYDLDDNEINYEWAVYFDMDNDNSLSRGDLALSVSRQKLPGTEETEENVLSNTLDRLLEVDLNGTMKFIANAYANISGNAINLTVLKSDYHKLSKISLSTKVKFKAFHNDGSSTYGDMYPNSGSFE